MNLLIEAHQLQGNTVVSHGRYYTKENRTIYRTAEPNFKIVQVPNTNDFIIVWSNHFQHKLFCINSHPNDFSDNSLSRNIIETNTESIETFSISDKQELIIFSTYLAILEQESAEKALVYLYTSLIALLRDSNSCELFLASINEDLLSVDAIVHILNALSPIKEKIQNWDYFVRVSERRLTEMEGEVNAKDLLGVIL